MIGTLTIAGKESEKLGMFQLMVEGHKFFCREKFREAFNEYLSSINGEKIKVTFLHSGKPLHVQSESDSARRNRKKFDTEKKAQKLRIFFTTVLSRCPRTRRNYFLIIIQIDFRQFREYCSRTLFYRHFPLIGKMRNVIYDVSLSGYPYVGHTDSSGCSRMKMTIYDYFYGKRKQ